MRAKGSNSSSYGRGKKNSDMAIGAMALQDHQGQVDPPGLIEHVAVEAPDGIECRKALRSRARIRNTRGFSLIELLIVIAIVLVVARFAVVGLQPILANARLANSYNTTLEMLRSAHDQAVAQRKIYQVVFTLPRTVTLNRIDLLPAQTPVLISTITLASDVSFDAESGLPSTANTGAPDGFGNGQATGAIYFVSGQPSVYFFPDGTARDTANVLNNGVVYLTRPGDLMNSKAVSVMALTGRIRGWSLQSGPAGKYWSQR